jgi:twitching motility two-component system response regulator PilG
MNDATGFPLFDPNAVPHKSNQRSAERFSNSCLDPDARERLASMYREHEGSECGETAAEPEAEARPAMSESLDALLSRASAEAAALSMNDSAAPVAEPSPEELVEQAIAAVAAGNGVAAETPAEAEEDVQELVQEIRREQSLNEIAEVAETFVAQQTGDPMPVADAPAEPTCGSMAAAAAQAASEIEAEPVPADAAVVEPQPADVNVLSEASLKSNVPWEPITEAAKRYDVDQTAQAAESVAGSPAQEAPAPKPKAPAPAVPERRRKRRALISAPLRVRTKNLTGAGLDEVANTVDVSRLGVLFQTGLDCYQRGMELMVTFPYSKVPHGIQAEQPGVVARVQEMEDGKRRVAIVLGVVAGEHCVDAYGRKLGHTPVHLKLENASNGMLGEKLNRADVKKPLVLAVDASAPTREALKACLEKEGYEVLALSSSAEGRDVLNVVTPSLIFAEVEGEGLPGYDLCAFVKQMPRLRHVPVVLTTSSAYPSDYSSAHSLGAVVCMAKPYKMERITNIARLLAPPPMSAKNEFAPRPADPTRIPGRDCNVSTRNGSGASKTATPPARNGKKPANDVKSLFKFPSFRTLSK